ncbi:efflux RND transporter periplasmic adaptor subunit [Rhodanobacter sp. 115]|uniref:efflux RND transporter periplasmic adaptor subunit n=1 Tax=Rhodanobacter sp. FW021-MT20 TaxID=1162282 RepID=UPI000260F4D0|nr:efflux RND transporter periplasmic adaptor subunit [Rhodanobacter sp. 115]EIL94374.1 Cobalt/zinc/cadmium efflux RND transporter,membrane fusion protein, CzcB family [Rhodanobacter sp. 115]
MKRGWMIVGAALLAAALLALGYVGGRHAGSASMPTSSATSANNTQHKVLYWYDPMTPQQHFDHPGASPMGMEMVPKYADESGSGDHDIVRVSAAEVQNLGMRTTKVEVGRLTDTVQVPGTVAWDQQLAVTVNARTNVTLEKLYVRAPFTAVKAGQPLAEVLAPQWSAAAAEYFALTGAESADARSLRAAARERLHVLGMDDATIRGLRASRGTITLRAPIDGVVSQLDVQEGQQVGEGMPIMSINGLDKVWVDAAIPQAQSGGITAGTPITATVTTLPGETFQGEVEALLPDVSAATRTQRARIVLDNPKHDLAPGMFADVRIQGAASMPHPLVPTEAVIADGVHTRVIEALSDGQFKPVLVRTGRSSGDMTVILAGLQGGERIVTSGQFLIDSEASLSGALTRMEAGNTGAPAAGASSAKASAMPGMQMPAASSGSNPGKPEPSSPVAPTKGKASNAMPGMDMPTPAASASSGRGDSP